MTQKKKKNNTKRKQNNTNRSSTFLILNVLTFQLNHQTIQLPINIIYIYILKQ